MNAAAQNMGWSRLSWRVAMTFALCAIVMRAFLPSGYMPNWNSSSAAKFEIVLCAADGRLHTQIIELPIEGESDPENALVDCPFGILSLSAAAGGDNPSLPVVDAIYLVEETFSNVLHFVIGHPPTGPPLGSRAPPFGLI